MCPWGVWMADKLILKTPTGEKEIPLIMYGTMTLTIVNGQVTYIDRTEREKVE